MTGATAISKTIPTAAWFDLYVLQSGPAVPVPGAAPQALVQRLQDGSAGGLILYRAPARALAQAMRAGATPAAALARWRQAAEPCLALLRHHRGRIRVVLWPEGAAALAEACPGIELSAPAAAGEAGDPLLEALAALALHNDPAGCDLLHALQAATSGPFDELPAPAALLATALTGWQAETRRQGAETAALQAELQDTRTALAAASGTQDGLERMTALLAEQVGALETTQVETVACRDTETSRLEARLAELRAAQQALQAAAADQAAENSELQEELQGERSALATVRGAQGELEQMVALLAEQVTALEATLLEAAARHDAETGVREARLAELRRDYEALRAVSAGQAATISEKSRLIDAAARDRRALERQVSELGRTLARRDAVPVAAPVVEDAPGEEPPPAPFRVRRRRRRGA